MNMLYSINGEPYTCWHEDVVLQRLRSITAQYLRDAISEALRHGSNDGHLQIDLRPLYHFGQVVYALGRAKECDRRPPSPIELERQQQLMQQITDQLGAVLEVLRDTGQITIDLRDVLSGLDQLYYAGREDGAH